MAEIMLTYLNRPDIARLDLTNDEILGAVESGLRAQGDGQAVIEPRVHLQPDPAFRGHFNVLRGLCSFSTSLMGVAGHTSWFG
jgi:alanine dehydrogenase